MSNQIAGQPGCLSLRSQRIGESLPRHRYRGWLRLALLVLCAWLLPKVAQAQDYAAAGQHFDAAQEAFQRGDFKRAAAEYQAAYAITKDPALLFSIGESFQRAAERSSGSRKRAGTKLGKVAPPGAVRSIAATLPR